MKRYFRFHQILVLSTAAFVLLGAGAVAFYQAAATPSPIQIETDGCPCVGKLDAPIQMVLFEDFRCGSCRTFNEVVLPEIQTRYIDLGLAKFTVVPLAFLRGSKPLANAALAVYKIAPSRIIPFMHALFQNTESSSSERIMEISREVGGIDPFELKACLSTHCYYPELEKNFELAKEVMGRDFGTPALYINGIETSTGSFESVRIRVEKLMLKRSK